MSADENVKKPWKRLKRWATTSKNMTKDISRVF